MEIRIDQTGDARKGIKGIAGSIGKIAGIGLAAGTAAVVGVAALTAGIVKLGSKLSSLGADAEEMEAKFNVVFGKGAPEAVKELDEFGNAVGRNKYDLMEMAATVQDTFVPLGFARDTAADMSVGLTKLAVDVGSFNNVLAPNVMRDFQSAIVGNTETVRKYGIVINQARIESKAAEMGLIEYTVSEEEAAAMTAKVELAQAKLNEVLAKHPADSVKALAAKQKLFEAEGKLTSVMLGEAEAISETAKAQVIMQIITESTTDAQGDALSTAGSWTNQMLALKDSVTEGATEMGLMLNEALLPLLAQFVPWVKDIIPKAVELFGDFAIKLGENLGPALVMVKDAVRRIAEAFGVNTEEVSSTDAVLAVFKTGLDGVVLLVQVAAIAMQGLASAVEWVRDAVGWLIDKWAELKRFLETPINLPDWLVPGSSTPFELGLRGIADAADDLDWGGLNVQPSVGGAGGITVNLIYSPPISLADQYEAEEKLAPFIARELQKLGMA
ncbi:MAG: hypothetical protein HWN68_19215 [Desulfobacterales bacterium]|nr:hypothetical protein [Desulfobacterales bacterium]